MKVGVIGCGMSGLAVIRRCKEYNLECIAFESTEDIGGTWVFVENVGLDDYQLPIHSSMYSSLRTNLPKHIMEFPDFKYRTSCEMFPNYKEVYNYLHEFANAFDLWPHIKLCHYVVSVKRILTGDDHNWELIAKDLKLNVDMYYKFDAIVVANGHYSVPVYPNFDGIETFEGLVIHSHDYRMANRFRNKRVLIIGSRSSGMDLTFEFRNVTHITYLSSRKDFKETKFPKNVVLKPDVSSVLKNKVNFTDGSCEFVDVILFCTGYKFSFPFLDKSCGIEAKDNSVIPLYKDLINISEPSMCFLLLLNVTLTFSVADLQAHFFVKTIKGAIDLPSKNEMRQCWQEDFDERCKRNIKLHNFQPEFFENAYLSCRKYCRDLENLGQIKPIPNVLFRIYEMNTKQFLKCYNNLRKIQYEVLDDENFNATLFLDE